MNIKIIGVGKIKETYFREGIQEYAKRITKYAHLEIVEVPDVPIPDNPSLKQIDAIQIAESKNILKQIHPSDFVISLEPYGKQLSSEELATHIKNITVQGFSTIDFIIGGTTGLAKEVLEKSHELLSFSKLTFPHPLIRLFLTEQLFRCFKIIHNERYHW